MAKIPAEIKEFIKDKPGWVATASKDGMPNVAIKGSLRIQDDEHIMFADLFSLKTRANLEENSKVAVMVADIANRSGYILKGTAEIITSGPIFEQMEEALKKSPAKLPPLLSVVRISVSEIHDQSLGPNAGKRLV